MESITELRLNQKDAAALLGIDRRNLTREGDIAPREPDGTYLATELVAWFADRLLLPEDVTAEQAPAKLLELFQEKLSDQLQRLNIRVTGGPVDSCEHLPSLDD